MHYLAYNRLVEVVSPQLVLQCDLHFWEAGGYLGLPQSAILS